MPLPDLESVPAAQAERTEYPVIRIERIGHRYDERQALDDVSFDVRAAEIFGLLGPNGSGKTTLFRILSTLMLPTTGRATIMGHDAAREPNQVRREIGVVFQAASVDAKLTVAENLRHQGHLYGLSGSALKRRIAEMLGRVGLADRANDRVEKLSGGQQRRVELAKGLLHHPSVLLRDEERVTVVVTTHLMEEAEHCDRLAILNEGKLVALGTPAELKREIGGEVIVMEARDPESLARRITERFGPCSVIDGKVRLEREHGHRFVTEVVEAFPGEIDSISVSKPTLEDVFIDRTGHRFWTGPESETP